MPMVGLRAIQQGDKEMMRAWRNMSHVAMYMYTDHEITIEEHGRWFKRIQNDPSVKYWIIQIDGRDVGVANLFNVDEYNKRCFWAFYLADTGLRGGGLGSFIEYAVLSYVFDNRKMEKLCCEVLAFNESVVSLHTKFGFKQEGYFRKHVVKGNQRVDIYCLGMLREEWEQFKKSKIAERLRDRVVFD